LVYGYGIGGGFVMGGGGMAMCGFLNRGLLGVESRGSRGW